MLPRFDSGPVPYVVRICCWICSCSEGLSPRSLVFHSPQKSTSPNSNSTRIGDRIKKTKTDVMYATPRFVLLFLCIISFYIHCILQLKCHKYWPDETQDYGDISVMLVKTEHYSDYIIRTFNVKRVCSTSVIRLFP